MYFITNSENLIIAASNSLLKKLEIDDICLVSKAIQNRLLVINEDKNELELLTENESYNYTQEIIQSFLGELKVFKIEESLNKEAVKEVKEDIEKNILLIGQDKDKKESETFDDLLIKEDKIETLELEELKIPEIPKEAIEEELSLVKLNDEDLEVKKEEFNDEINRTNDEDLTLILEEENKQKDTLEVVNKEPKEKYIKIENLYEEKEDEILTVLDEDKEKKSKGIFSKSIFPWKKDNEKKEFKEEILDKKDRETEAIEKKLESEGIEDIQKDKELLNLDELIKEETEDIKELKEEKPEKKVIEGLSLIADVEKKDEIKDELKPKKEDIEELSLVIEDLEKEKPLKEENLTKSENDFLELEKALLEDEKEELKETKSSIEIKKIEDEKVSSENIVNKIVDIQIDNIDFKENAKRLNLDIDSYKMLTKSYLEEIKGYMPQLSKGDKDIKNMLIDAGQLLSLNGLVIKINKLNEDEEFNKNIINEINSYIELLEQKLNKKEEDFSTKKEIRPSTNIENKEIEAKNLSEKTDEEIITYEKKVPVKNEAIELKDTEKEIVPVENTHIEENIAQDLIDLESAKGLLEQINAEKVELDIEKISEELNLPEELIKEFLKDFLNLAKMHLPDMIKNYNENDLESLHTVAHSLKGAANNLRLNKIGENLAKLQKENNLDKIDEIIKRFAAHIKGLEEIMAELGE